VRINSQIAYFEYIKNSIPEFGRNSLPKMAEFYSQIWLEWLKKDLVGMQKYNP